MNETIRYIISFLLYGNNDAVDRVGYGAAAVNQEQKNIQLVASPLSPLNNRQSTWQDFATEVEAAIKAKTIEEVFAKFDVVSIACFFISRAEELYNQNTDAHGRLTAANSILGRHNSLLIPILDEYARHLLKMLDLPLPPQELKQIYLTHDVDQITQYRSLRGFAGGLKRGEFKAVCHALKKVENDDAFTFNLLKKIDNSLPVAKQIYFLKAQEHGQLSHYDCPKYNLQSADAKKMLSIIMDERTSIGLHYSYASADKPELITAERQQINSQYLRAHYLRSTIDSFNVIRSGEEFSMGFADMVGFRLATTRSVKWINPKTLILTDLMMHPLNIMDTTLNSEHYMNLEDNEAFYVCQQVVDRVMRYGGDLCLLWHNSNINKGYNKKLYQQLIEYIKHLK